MLERMGSVCDEPCDEGVTRDWVHAHILQDLQPIPPLTVLGHGDSTKQVHARGSARGRRKVRRLVTEFAEQCRGIIKKRVKKALDSGCKLTFGVDTWKIRARSGGTTTCCWHGGSIQIGSASRCAWTSVCCGLALSEGVRLCTVPHTQIQAGRVCRSMPSHRTIALPL